MIVSVGKMYFYMLWVKMQNLPTKVDGNSQGVFEDDGGLQVLMIWANRLFSFNMSFLSRKVENVTTISKHSHSLW